MIAWLTGPVPQGRAIWYQKHMSHHMEGPVSIADFPAMRHAFLIRDPRRVAASYAKKRTAIRVEHLGLGDANPAASISQAPATDAPVGGLRQRMDAVARREVLDALRRHDGRWTAAARELAVTPSNLQRLAKRLGINTTSA